jgi:uncharacterized DUF497 family protein
MELNFEWDEAKAATNLQRHQISFEEAKTVFNDPFLQTFPDPDHSEDEERYLSIGQSAAGTICIVIHTERQAIIRLISCRKATRKERNDYAQGNFSK